MIAGRRERIIFRVIGAVLFVAGLALAVKLPCACAAEGACPAEHVCPDPQLLLRLVIAVGGWVAATVMWGVSAWLSPYTERDESGRDAGRRTGFRLFTARARASRARDRL